MSEVPLYPSHVAPISLTDFSATRSWLQVGARDSQGVSLGQTGDEPEARRVMSLRELTNEAFFGSACVRLLAWRGLASLCTSGVSQGASRRGSALPCLHDRYRYSLALRHRGISL